MQLSMAGHQETVMAVLPFYHAYGVVGILCLGMLGGHKLVIQPKFEPKTFLGAIQKFKVKIVLYWWYPRVYGFIINKVKDFK
jgi:long-chain acyl-CoA synthetase